MAEHWRGPINGLLYGLIFTPEITDETVTDCADAALNYTVLGSGPEVYYEAIQKALTSGERLDGLGQLPQFDQAQIAEFLRALADRLDALRPWPEPKFLRLQASSWARFAHASDCGDPSAVMELVSRGGANADCPDGKGHAETDYTTLFWDDARMCFAASLQERTTAMP